MLSDVHAFAVSPAWLISLGFAVGILSGLLGVGGGILMTPALHVLGMTMPAAVATSLTQMVGASLSGSYKHFRLNNVSGGLALLLGVPGVLGMTLGRYLLLSWSGEEADRILSSLYMALMLYISFNMYRKLSRPAKIERPHVWFNLGPKIQLGPEKRQIAILPCIGAGAFVGLLSSLTGLGGGFFYLPALIVLAGCTMKQAIGTSLATVFLSSFYGAVVYGAAGVSDIPAALFLMVGSVGGAQLGAIAADRAQNRRLQFLFLILVLAAFISMMLKKSGAILTAHFLLFGSGLLIISIAVGSVVFSKTSKQK